MARFGSFMGGLAQGIQSGLPMLIQARQQDQMMQLKQQEMELQQKQLEAKNRTEMQVKQLDAATKGVDTLIKTNPEQVGPYVAGWISRYEQQFNPLPMAFKSSLKKSPQEVLSIINNGNPDEIRSALGSEQNFLEMWPRIVQSAAESKSNALEKQATGLSVSPQLNQMMPGMADIDRQIAIKEQLIEEMNKSDLPRSRIEGVQKQLDELKKQRTSIAVSPTAQNAMAAGVDVSGMLSGAGARAAQAREIQQGQEKAYGEAAARESGQFMGGRISVEEAAKLGLPAFTQKPLLAPEGGGGIVPPSPQKQQIQIKQFENANDQAKADFKAADEAKAKLPNVQQLMGLVKRLGPTMQGPITGPIQSAISKALAGSGIDASNIQTFDGLVNLLALDYAQKVRPVSDTDMKIIRESLGSTNRSYQSNLEVLGAINRELQRNATLGSYAGSFLEGRMGPDKGYFTRRQEVLNGFDKANKVPGTPAVPKSQAALPAAPQMGGRGTGEAWAMSVGSGGPIWKRFDPATKAAIGDFPPALQSTLAALKMVESGTREVSAEKPLMHPAPRVGAAAQGPTGIKPQYMNDFGLPGIRQINNPNDPVQAFGWTADVLSALNDHYNGNKRLALAAYNQGFPTIDAALKLTQTGKGDPNLRGKLQQGLAYADKVMALADRTSPINQAQTVAALPAHIKKEQPLDETDRELARFILEGGFAIGAAKLGAMAAARYGIRGLEKLGSAVGAGLGSIAAEPVDPTQAPLTEALKTAAFQGTGEIISGLVGRLMNPSTLSKEGAVYYDMLKSSGREDLVLPGRASNSSILQAAQDMAQQSKFMGGRVLKIMEAANKQFQDLGTEYAERFLAEKAIGKQKYQQFDQVAKQPVDFTIASGISKALRREYGVRLEGTVLPPAGLTNALNKVDELRKAQLAGKQISFNEVQGVQQDLWAIWQANQEKDPATGRSLIRLIDGLDKSMEASARAAGSNAYKLYKEANAHYQIGKQGTMMETLLSKARIGQTGADQFGFINPATLANQFADKNLKNLPVKLSDEQIAFWRDLATAMKANAGHESFMRVMAMGAEFGGTISLATMAAQGNAISGAGLITSIMTLAPSALAVATTNPTFKKLILEGIRVQPGTAAAFNVARRLGNLIVQEHWAPPHRIEQNEQPRNVLTPTPQ